MESRAPYKTPMTAEDLMAIESSHSILELSRGELIEEPLPGTIHGLVTASLCGKLYAYAESTGGGRVLTCDAGFVLARNPDTVRGPDVAYLRNDHSSDLRSTAGWIEAPPDLAVEVLSPSDTRARVARKIRDYLDAKVPLIWLVQPKNQTITVIENGVERALAAGENLEAPGLLPGFSMSVASVFR